MLLKKKVFLNFSTNTFFPLFDHQPEFIQSNKYKNINEDVIYLSFDAERRVCVFKFIGAIG